MSRIARYRWFVIGVIILVLGLVSFYIIRITPATRPGESADERATRAHPDATQPPLDPR